MWFQGCTGDCLKTQVITEDHAKTMSKIFSACVLLLQRRRSEYNRIQLKRRVMRDWMDTQRIFTHTFSKNNNKDVEYVLKHDGTVCFSTTTKKPTHKVFTNHNHQKKNTQFFYIVCHDFVCIFLDHSNYISN